MLKVEKETAVSPVIGVMLLLAIVIILAALVASFASGAADAKEKAPSVDIAVYAAGSEKNFTLVFEHRGGDPLRTGDLRINTWVHLPDGGQCPATHDRDVLNTLFGTDIWAAGYSANTGDRKATDAFLELDGKLPDRIKESAVVEVAIYHLPSGSLLHKSSFLLKER
ncbi:type IV pilin N-terminal domain-containing protein [Methanofollis ethanolicus]|uniref:type IV pilin N-terminal domain-containing protein n=1 Tax=Methanofollis ethanolicus TaxID=488124 RepID=UPI0009F99865|nr:type IV pilin N-terminal domain-containing protein [Methanofollis ethanolicus]